MAAIGFASFGSSAAAASVRLEARSAELVITALERGDLNVNLAEAVRRDPGYRLVFEHLAGPERRPAAVAAEFIAALDDVAGGGNDPRFGLAAAREAREAWRDAVRAFRRAERRVTLDVRSRLEEMLPAGVDLDATVYLVAGGVPTAAFEEGGRLVIRFDDFVPEGPGAEPDLPGLAALVGGELFRIGFRAAGGTPPRPRDVDDAWLALAATWGPNLVGEVWRASGEAWHAPAMKARLEAWVRPATWTWLALDRYLAMLARIQEEGTVRYAAEAPRDGRGRADGGDVDEGFAFLARVTDRLGHGADADEIDRMAAWGFEDGGPLARIGRSMARRIDDFSGRDALRRTIEGGVLEFYDAYFATHPYGPGQMDSGTEMDVRRLIKEIRQAGRSAAG